MIVRFVCAALFLALGGAILWAGASASFWDSFALITGDAWGVVTLIDLYSGFFAMAVVIGLVDGPRVGIIAFVLLCVLGNLVSLAWLAFQGYQRLLSLVASGALRS